ncbi:Uncharacterised protein [Mycobacteroides abscessus]|nr:Uncharacterised protein [Mycobacteroides abscessus]
MRAPKSTSVPLVARVAATGSSPSRSATRSGAHSAMTAGSSVNSSSLNSGWRRSVSKRRRR